MIDHRDIAERAFEMSGLQPTPPNRTGAQVFVYLQMLLALLPPEEEAGYVKAPANGENVIALPDGTVVRTARVCYPDGQLYKVMNDVPNGRPQWVPEDVRPELYVPFAGSHTGPEPAPSEPPTPGPWAEHLAALDGRVQAFEKQLDKVDKRVITLEARPVPPVVAPPVIKKPWWWPL